jgi:cyclopropane fatty-acyl-phospholipid synthase-like methyltransferase
MMGLPTALSLRLMKNLLTALFQRDRLDDFWPRMRIEILGLIEDFWQDPAPAKNEKTKTQNAPSKPVFEKKKAKKKADADQMSSQPFVRTQKFWHADRFQVMEKIWGPGRTLPSNDELEKLIVAPLGPNKEMNVLDLAAGLGGLARRLATENKAYVTGLERNEVMARRGMALSVEEGKSKQVAIDPYNPAEFSSDKRYDCIIARELFYNIIGKEKFFQTVASSLKQHGVLVFTDYILDMKFRGNKAVAGWLSLEANALPYSLQDMIQAWTKLKFDVRLNEDLTDMYRHEIVKRLKNFADFLAKNPPDDDTKQNVFLETEKWARRAAALQEGLKFYRFEALKN